MIQLQGDLDSFSFFHYQSLSGGVQWPFDLEDIRNPVPLVIKYRKGATHSFIRRNQNRYNCRLRNASGKDWQNKLIILLFKTRKFAMIFLAICLTVKTNRCYDIFVHLSFLHRPCLWNDESFLASFSFPFVS